MEQYDRTVLSRRQTRRYIVAKGVKLAYAAPIVAATMKVSASRVAAVSDAGTSTCIQKGQICERSSQCCSGFCQRAGSDGSGGVLRKCADRCLDSGASCASGSQCCTGYCANGQCSCRPEGEICSESTQCCGDLSCRRAGKDANGNTIRRCAP